MSLFYDCDFVPIITALQQLVSCNVSVYPTVYVTSSDIRFTAHRAVSMLRWRERFDDSRLEHAFYWKIVLWIY
jgi:hypothetical protein